MIERIKDGDTEIVSAEASAGDDITIDSPPDVLTCEVTSTDGSTTYQVVTINTSGEADFYLKDKFGAMQVEACDDSDCLEVSPQDCGADEEVTRCDPLFPGVGC